MAESPHNLPVQPTPLIGREREVRAAQELLVDVAVRLVTLTGPGGTGKTRVGIQVAAELCAAFPDGIVFVGLAPIVDAALVIPTIARAVGIHDAGNRPILETLQAHLREKRLLLLLDNFEQILAAGPDVSNLLAACPGLSVLVTSRARLHLRGEQECPVPPLPLPAHQEIGGHSAVDVLSQNPSVALFVQRAREVKPDFCLTDESAPIVAEICRRLDGLPLAIELAAARSKLLAPQALLARLERRLTLLTSGPQDAPERQRALRDTLAWSYDLLTPDEQRLFRRLSVFVGGCTLDAAETVCQSGGGTGPDIFDGLASLVDKSLLGQESGTDGEPRFTMLETVREYALEQLAASGEEADARRRHLDWFEGLSRRSQPKIYGPDATNWLDRLEADLYNLRGALTWSLADSEPASGEAGLRLSAALSWFWLLRDHLSEGRGWLEAVLEADGRHDQPGWHGGDGPSAETRPETPGASDWEGALGSHARVEVLNALANCQQQQGSLDAARSSADEALAIARRVRDRLGSGFALLMLGVIVRSAGEYAPAISLFDEALGIFRSLDARHGIWRTLSNLAETQTRVDNLDTARQQVEEALAVAQSMGFIWGTAYSLRQLGVILSRQGHTARAIALLEESGRGFERLRANHGRNFALIDLGQAHLAGDDPQHAAPCFAESLARCHVAGDRYSIARCLEGLAGVVTAVGPGRIDTWSDGAARLLGATAALRETIGFSVSPVERPVVERVATLARASLGDAAYEAALATGRALPLNQAVGLGLGLAQQIQDIGPEPAAASASTMQPAPGDDRGPGSALTAREREVAALIGLGYSNRRIAERLVIAEKTAEVHARNIREKLGLQSRAQIAAWAAQHGLLAEGD
jgi:predicted ATPase/DNA-binding CsgD family transcriptional regulator